MRVVGGDLKVPYDLWDSHLPDAHFFTEFELFDRHVYKLRRRGEKIDYVPICSPNDLDDPDCGFAFAVWRRC